MAILSGLAGGTINPARFCIQDVSQDNAYVQASGTGRPIIGPAQVGAALAPVPNAGTGAAAAGDTIGVFTTGEVTFVSVTSAITAGDTLSADSSGFGVKDTVSGHYIGGLALESVSGTSFCKILVTSGLKN